MRKNLHYRSFITGACLLLTTISFSQSSDRFAYAITDVNQQGAGWNVLRKINTQTGEYTDVLLNGSDTKLQVYDAATKKAYEVPVDPKYGNIFQAAFGTGVAAAAYDKRNNRLYFTPMQIDQLRYIDLRTMKLYYITDQAFTGLGNLHNDEGKIVTRMVITPSGDGYAITNDGNTFVQFSTTKKGKPVVLGGLIDDPENGGLSIHNRCTSFGGDMVADDDGNLYIISARNNVFKVDIETRVTKHLGTIEGLPENFTTNGVVVDEHGTLIVSSAVYDKSYYTVTPKGWTATEYKASAGVFRSSDLANSNLLATRKRSQTPVIETVTRLDIPLSKNVMVYPNPVTNKNFTVQFSQLQAGNYSIELTDITGRLVMKKNVYVGGEEQVETVSLKSTTAGGIYMVKVVNAEKTVFTQKIMIQ